HLPLLCRGDKFASPPAADTILRDGGKVGRIKSAERGFERHAPAQPGAVLLVGTGVTGGAAAGKEHGPAVVEICGVRPERARRDSLCSSHEPKDGYADQSQKQ